MKIATGMILDEIPAPLFEEFSKIFEENALTKNKYL
jgi:hypothetical protein